MNILNVSFIINGNRIISDNGISDAYIYIISFTNIFTSFIYLPSVYNKKTNNFFINYNECYIYFIFYLNIFIAFIFSLRKA